jgi:hypothetical protein
MPQGKVFERVDSVENVFRDSAFDYEMPDESANIFQVGVGCQVRYRSKNIFALTGIGSGLG